MRKWLLILLMLLIIRIPLDVWQGLNDDDRRAGIQQIVNIVAEKEGCAKIQVSIGQSEKWVYLKFECKVEEI